MPLTKDERAWLDERFQRIYDKIDGMENTVNRRMDNMSEQNRKQDTTLEDHEDRISILERYKWLFVGVFAFLSPVVIWAIIELLKGL